MSRHNNIYRIIIGNREIYFYSGHEGATRANLSNFSIKFEKLELHQTITDKDRSPIWIKGSFILGFTELYHHFGGQTDYSIRRFGKKKTPDKFGILLKEKE